MMMNTVTEKKNMITMNKRIEVNKDEYKVNN